MISSYLRGLSRERTNIIVLDVPNLDRDARYKCIGGIGDDSSYPWHPARGGPTTSRNKIPGKGTSKWHQQHLFSSEYTLPVCQKDRWKFAFFSFVTILVIAL